MKKALVLLSGGQDSTTCLFWAIEKFGRENVYALGYDYGQRHVAELTFAQAICDAQGISFSVVALPAIRELTDNALTNQSRSVDICKPHDAPPNTLVEGRNMLFLTYAAIFAKTRGISVLVTGVCETDFSGYPDCRDVFIKSCNVTLSLGFDYAFEVETPLMWLTKAETWALAARLGVLDLVREQTLTCYNSVRGDGCGNCPACALRKKGYEIYVRNQENI